MQLALDDFGTGYSSLSHLRDFPIHMLKIAKPFVDRIDSDSTFVEAVSRVGRRPSASRVLAEGIDAQERADTLRSLGCALGQGYCYARPSEALQIRITLSVRAG